PKPPVPAAGAAPAGAAPTAAASVPAQDASTSTSTVVLPRDPMLSPYDVLRMREREAEKQAEEERLKQAAWEAAHRRRAVHRAPKEPPIEDSVELQGIVARPDGRNMAIVNGSTYSEGDSFAVDGRSARVKVLRITSSTVFFEYKKHRFKMSVSAD
ncbi:MAG: hypothetical protein KGM24_04080, partial [Elusimicrobia bacterium]|nr:hypothetical protein [Elusimicrobiota bacterium]